MKTLIATLLATAAGASFAAAPTFGLNHDAATYRALTQKAGAAYKAAVDKCENLKGNDQDVCMAEARLARTRAEAEALSRYNTSPASQAKVRTELANAEYNVAKARCDAKSGADKDDCLNNAKSVHTAAVADAKAGKPAADATNASGASAAGTTAAGGGAAVAAGAAGTGDAAKTAVLVQDKPSAVRENASDAAADTKSVAAKAAEKTKEAAHIVVEKTKQVAAVVAQKTEAVLDRGGDKAEKATDKADKAADNAADKTADKTEDAAAKARVAAADTAITTKVKAGLVKEKNLESLGIHVETEKGVVMLSGFVNSKAEADKAVSVAKGVDGVTSVRSAIQVK